MNVYIYIYTHMRVCVYIHVYMYIYIHAYVCVHRYICIHICIYIHCLYMCTHICGSCPWQALVEEAPVARRPSTAIMASSGARELGDFSCSWQKRCKGPKAQRVGRALKC